MFELTTKNVHLNQQAKNKTDAINQVAQALIDADFAKNGYNEGMQNREMQSATYLGNGIAIPHGTIETRNLVKKTGVQIFHFPEGIKWNEEGEIAFVAIGIAASSDEHLSLLRQLTHVLDDENLVEKLKNIQSEDDLIAILSGKSQNSAEIFIDSSLILLDFPAENLQMLQALNVTRLKKKFAINSQFITHIFEHNPIHLGNGIWLNDSPKGNLKNAIAITRSSKKITENNNPVKLLITIAAIDRSFDFVLENLAQILFKGETDDFIFGNENAFIQFFKSEKNSKESIQKNAETTKDNEISAEFVILNSHGLHTRPGSVLLKVIKSFESEIFVENLNGANELVNAASLMKIVSLGAKKGDRLRFLANGKDAEQALDAIGKAISEGLGEGV